jgi:hypothetical protein
MVVVASVIGHVYVRMFTVRATTRMASEIISSSRIKHLAHGFIAETSVGLDAVEPRRCQTDSR